tara:strand:+ start:5445 stop:6725 length:1281 start_codon:yes stop_codon:yes gene_type:complete
LVANFQAIIDSVEQNRSQLEKQRTHAEQAAKGKDLFLASMSHEIRTQLNGMTGILELLLNDNQLLENQRASLMTMKRSSGTLKRILNDILDYTQLCAYEVQLESVSFSPANTVQEVVSMFEANARAKGLSLLSMVSEQVPESVEGDEARLRQVLSNLLGNAIKFTNSGRVGVFLTGESREDGGTELQFEVLDTGIGLSQDQLSELFQPFAQGDATTKRKYGGSGLGLLICKNLVERMGGSIHVQSEPGVGSEFQFSILVDQDAKLESDSSAPDITILPRGDELQEVRRKVLLAEDNEVNQIVAKMTLERLGYEVDVANDGGEAITAATERDYDLICMDVTMPEIDGLEATRRIRKLEQPSSDALIIAMTGHAFSEDRIRCLDAGMDDFISKPFEIEQLKVTIERGWSSPRFTTEATDTHRPEVKVA